MLNTNTQYSIARHLSADLHIHAVVHIHHFRKGFVATNQGTGKKLQKNHSFNFAVGWKPDLARNGIPL